MAWTAPRTWVAGETVTAALMNSAVRDNLKAIGDPWTTYAPALGNWTLGNGTLTGAFLKTGGLGFFRISYTVGSTDTISGAPTFSVPFTIATGFPPSAACGRAHLFDTSATAHRYWTAVVNTTTTVIVRDEIGTNVNASTPWTWAAGDTFVIAGSCEVA